MKKAVVLLFLLLMSFSFVYAQDKSVEGYAEVVGEGILKVQGALMGALSFISLGALGEGGTFAFSQFLFIVLFFMLMYGILTFTSFVSEGVRIPIALIISVLAFMYIDAAAIEAMLTNYEAMGITLTLVLPILILLAFTFRMYQKAHDGKSDKSPFYAKLFNLVLLVFFGIFFIRYSASEEGIIGLARYWSGWFLIGFGVVQFLLLYSLLASWIGGVKGDYNKGRREEKAENSKLAEKIDKIKVDSIKKTVKTKQDGKKPKEKSLAQLALESQIPKSDND